jgi:nicotinate-nucleotide adenylyltransferase
MRPNQAIGIIGGTFDPIHFGHLRMALELKTTLDLSRVHFIPCYQPVHRALPLASADARVEMVKTAIKGNPDFFLDLREIKRQGKSYFIDTLIDLRQEMKTASLCIFIGLDEFLNFTTWHRYLEILEYGHLVIAHRLQYDLPQSGLLADFLNKHLQKQGDFIHNNLAGGIFLQTITALEISSSGIRNQIAAGKNPSYLLPETVYDYIKQHQLYRP